MNPTQNPSSKGLFAHIQSNNLRSLLLFVGFGVLLQLLQVSVFVFQVSLFKPQQLILRDFERLRAHGPDEVKSNFKKIMERAPGAGTPDQQLRTKLTPLDPNVGTFHNRVADELNKDKLLPGRNQYNFFGELWTDLDQRTGLFKGQSLYIFVPALLYVIGGSYFIGFFTRHQTGAHRVERRNEPRLFGLLEPLAISRGLPMPAVEIVESDGRNAYASGIHPQNSAIGVSRGLLNCLHDNELQAVLAHELAHIEHRDNRLMALANLCAGTITPLGRKIYNGVCRHPFFGIIFIFWTLVMLPWQAAVIFYGTVFATIGLANALIFLISRKREFIADARAIEMVKEPAALISALNKIAVNDRIEGLNPVVQSMMISNLSGVGRATHPSIDARINAICATTNVREEDAARAVQRVNRLHWAGAVDTPTPVSLPMQRQGEMKRGFGRRRATQVAGGNPHPTYPPSSPPQPAPSLQDQKKIDLEKKLKSANSLATKVIHWTLLVYTAPIWLPFVVLPAIFIYYMLSSILPVAMCLLAIAGVIYWRKHSHTQ